MVKKRKTTIGKDMLGNEEIEFVVCSVCGGGSLSYQHMTSNIGGKTICCECQNPSEATDWYWIFASRKKGEYPRSDDWVFALGGTGRRPECTPRGGKWLIFVNVKDVDEVWAKIKKATEEGRLGAETKVSTVKPKPTDIGYKKGEHVICVYTYDWNDEKDVRRIREELRKLGITNKIPYKADEDGRYAARGHKRISKYYE